MALTIGVALLIAAVVAIVLALRRSRPAKRDPVAVERVVALPELELLDVELPEPMSPEPMSPELELAPEPEPVITWTAALTDTSLDEAARLRLINDLALLAAPWATALLRRAYREESSPNLRARIEAALASTVEPIDVT
jgi:hypothetical protein